MPVTILEGSTFCLSDEVGDLDGKTGGFFAEDTRFLSRFTLTINGERPLLLSSGKVEYFSAAFYMRNPLAGGLGHDVLSVERRRFIGEAMQDVIVVENEGMEPALFVVGIDFGKDDSGIFAVETHYVALGDPLRADPLPPVVGGRFNGDGNVFLLEDPDDPSVQTQVVLSEPGEAKDSTVRYEVRLEPRERWEIQVGVFPSFDREEVPARLAARRFGEELGHLRDSLAAWQLRVPHIRASGEELGHTFTQSVADLAALRIRGGDHGIGKLPAAGMPWFMTVFGRDTLITCLQTLLFGPELAHTALSVLAELQATEDDPLVDAEPGKIVHEVRRGKAATTWFSAYYGTADATPLWLVLLSEVWRWTDDAALVRDLKQPALRALEWIDRYGDLDGDGFVEYRRRSERGLHNQSWKDSDDSQRFADGRLAQAPIAPVEVQGYVYDAKLRAAELAREVWRDRELRERLQREAEELKKRFDAAYWVEKRGGYYALALDAEKRQVDALCSNIGHLLWSGIVPPERVDAVVDALMGEALWSGWGVRTMSSEDAAFNPISYQNETVWPHDESIIPWGLAKCARWPEMHRIARRMLEAASHFDYQLPEVFAGLARQETPFPIAYPTAARPQAWAAGAPVLLVQVLLGLQPNRRRHDLETLAPPEIPSWAGEYMRLSGVRAFERAWDVRLVRGSVEVEAR